MPDGGLGAMKLVALRDQTLDGLNAWAKKRGRAYQQAFVDQYALSQQQVRNMQDKVVTQLATIQGNEALDQMKAAALLFKMNVVPVAMMSLHFGQDNHTDVNYAQAEVPQHAAAIATLNQWPQILADVGMTGKVTFCLLNTFGRTLAEVNGRGHNPNHAVSLLLGPQVKSSVVGGVVARPGDDYWAMPIDAQTGRGVATGDVPVAESLGAFGKTACAAAGMADDVIEANIDGGKQVAAALA